MSFTAVYEAYIQYFVWITVITIIGSLLMIWLCVKNGDKYLQEDSNAHAEEFGGVIAESHGPITTFLYVIYVILILWTLAYLWVHWGEFTGL